eukprot:6208390-Pleurochrysis_carterae.AAC.1
MDFIFTDDVTAKARLLRQTMKIHGLAGSVSAALRLCEYAAMPTARAERRGRAAAQRYREPPGGQHSAIKGDLLCVAEVLSQSLS